MTFDLWLGFAVASIVMGLIPGPGVMSIVGYAIGSGRTTALASVAGMALGNVLAMSLSLAGVGALLATSALAFSILKWVGAIYLIGLGLFTLVKSWGSLPLDSVPSPTISPRAAFANNVAVGVFHPKTIVFFVAFAPQFISTGGSYILQAATLVATFALVVGCTDTIYALVASRAANMMKGPRAVSWSKRASGSVLIVAGVATAAARR
jgi:threonine/homoserine/homoserine lactone efflux protein